VTSEVPRPDEPFDPKPAPDSPAHGDHTPDDHLGRESSQPSTPGPTSGPGEQPSAGASKGGCALILFLGTGVLAAGAALVPVVLRGILG
jgi:hypothetical protein